MSLKVWYLDHSGYRSAGISAHACFAWLFSAAASQHHSGFVRLLKPLARHICLRHACMCIKHAISVLLMAVTNRCSTVSYFLSLFLIGIVSIVVSDAVRYSVPAGSYIANASAALQPYTLPSALRPTCTCTTLQPHSAPLPCTPPAPLHAYNCTHLCTPTCTVAPLRPAPPAPSTLTPCTPPKPPYNVALLHTYSLHSPLRPYNNLLPYTLLPIPCGRTPNTPTPIDLCTPTAY